MTVGVALGVVAGGIAAVLLTQLLLPGELATLRELSRAAGQLGGASDSTTAIRLAAIVVGGLTVAAIVARAA